MPSTRSSRLEPAGAKRKASALDEPNDTIGSPEAQAPTRPTKQVKIKATKGTPNAGVKKTALKAASKSKPASSADAATKLYRDLNTVIDKRIDELNKKAKASKIGGLSMTMHEHYLSSACRHVKTVDKITEQDAKVGFNAAMSIADASLAGLQPMPVKTYAEDFECWANIDDRLCNLIPKLTQVASPITAERIPKVPERWENDKAEVGECKTGPGRLNKQQRGWRETQRARWVKDWNLSRRQRREHTEDWAAVALQDIRGEQKHLEEYGVELFMPRACEMLEAIVKSRGAGQAV